MQNKINWGYMVDTLEVDFNHAPSKTKMNFLNAKREELQLWHHGLGTHIRNKFKLWEHKWEPVLENGVDVSPNHPDAISMQVIIRLWERLQARKVEASQNIIAAQRKEIEDKIGRLEVDLQSLRNECTHPNATKTPRSDTGNYCKEDDRYWYDCKCPDCGKHWTLN